MEKMTLKEVVDDIKNKTRCVDCGVKANPGSPLLPVIRKGGTYRVCPSCHWRYADVVLKNISMEDFIQGAWKVFTSQIKLTDVNLGVNSLYVIVTNDLTSHEKMAEFNEKNWS